MQQESPVEMGRPKAHMPAAMMMGVTEMKKRGGEGTWGLASSAPTSRTQSAWEMQMRDQGVTAASASRMMNLRVARLQWADCGKSVPHEPPPMAVGAIAPAYGDL